MNWQLGTKVLLYSTAIVWAVWDCLAYHYGGEHATISWQIQQWCYGYPIFSVGVGLLLAHWAWRLGGVAKQKRNTKG